MTIDADEYAERHGPSRWKRGFVGLGSRNQLLFGPPEEIEPLLDFIQPEVLPDAIHQQFVLNLVVEPRHRITVTVPILVCGDPQVWRSALAYLVDSKKAFDDAKARGNVVNPIRTKPLKWEDNFW